MIQVRDLGDKKYVYVCQHQRSEGASCGVIGAEIRQQLKDRIQELGLKSQIRISKSGCLDLCSTGPCLIIEPGHIALEKLELTDIDKIVKKLTTDME